MRTLHGIARIAGWVGIAAAVAFLIATQGCAGSQELSQDDWPDCYAEARHAAVERCYTEHADCYTEHADTCMCADEIEPCGQSDLPVSEWSR